MEKILEMILSVAESTEKSDKRILDIIRKLNTLLLYLKLEATKIHEKNSVSIIADELREILEEIKLEISDISKNNKDGIQEIIEEIKKEQHNN